MIAARAKAALAAAALAAAAPGCRSRRDPDPAPASDEPAATTVAIDAAAPARPAATPARQRYVGSARCGECHADKLAAWKRSWHARALARADVRSVAGNYAHARFSGSSTRASMERRGARYAMRTPGATGDVGEFAVDWVIGGKRMQDAVTVFPDGRWQVLPVYYHVTGRGEWVDYTETKQGPLAPDHPFYWTNWRRMANHECLDCHTTGLDVAYDDGAGRWTTRFADAGVGCESCHGPGAAHAESSEPADIFHPVTASPALGLTACGQCHGPRNPLFPLLDADHHFVPGQSYDELYDPIVVVIAGKPSGDFFPDGRPRVSSFEYQSLIQSACFRRGGATCVTCHTAPHETHAASELRDADPDASCRGCHPAVAAAGRAHTHHEAAAAQRCVACHMPPVISGVLDHFADHALDVPAPQNTERHGVPSACGVCHADAPAPALSAQLAAWWPRALERQRRRLRLADAFDEATAADSAAALAAVVADRDEAPTLRGAAAIVLAHRFGPRAVAAVLPLLSEADVLVRAKACEALGIARDRSAADAVAAHRTDPSLRVRLAAAVALSSLGDRRAGPALIDLARDQATAHLLAPHLLLGPQLAARGDLDRARRELEWVERLAPYYADALVQLAEVAARQGDLAAARARVDRVLQADPHHPGALALDHRLPAP